MLQRGQAVFEVWSSASSRVWMKDRILEGIKVSKLASFLTRFEKEAKGFRFRFLVVGPDAPVSAKASLPKT